MSVDSTSIRAHHHAAGAVATTIDRFDSLGCSLPTTDRSTQPFPSSDQPLLDFSSFTLTPNAPATYTSVEGLAADGVAKVAVLKPSGDIAASTIVRNNVYAFASLPAERLTGLAAEDSSGQVFYTTILPGT